MDDYSDTHMCLVCQTTFIGLDNYVIHKRNGCPVNKNAHRSSKLDNEVMGGHSEPRSQNMMTDALNDIRNIEASFHGTPSIDSHNYQSIQHQNGESNHFRNTLPESSSTNQENTSRYLPLATCQNQSQTGIHSTGHHDSTSYHLPSGSQESIGFETTDHSISSLLGVHHSGNDHFHHSEDRVSNLNQLQNTAHSISSNINSSQVLPSIKTFRSCNRLIPPLRQESSEIPHSPHGVPPSLPFTHITHNSVHHSGHDSLSDSVSNDINSHHIQTLPTQAPTSSGLDISINTSHYTPSLASMNLNSTHHQHHNHHITQTQTTTSGTSVSTIGADVSDAVASFVSNLSPTTSRVVDPNLVLYEELPDKDTTFTDFFSSLELQYRVDSDTNRHIASKAEKSGTEHDTDHLKEASDVKFDLDHSKALNIASILNVLAFSSDSDNMLPTDAENLLDSTDEENETSIPNYPPSSHTGGKWGPGQKVIALKTDSQGKWTSLGKQISAKPTSLHGKLSNSSPGKYDSGKHKTGVGRGKAMGGKFKSLSPIQFGSGTESDEDKGNLSDDEREEEETPRVYKRKHTSRGKVFPPGKMMASEKVYFCKPCDRTLLNKVSYERHCSTTAHIKKCQNQDESRAPNFHGKNIEQLKECDKEIEAGNESIECTVCDKMFNNKYNFARHLVSSDHQKKALNGGRTMLLDETYQLLLSHQSRFQCHICQFYCNTSEQLHQHLETTQHEEATQTLFGPLLCVRCKFACRTNKEMIDHMESEQHTVIIDESDRPCVLRESRYRVQCRSCESIFHSATALKKHMETEHPEILEEHSPGKKKTKRGEAPVCQYCGQKLSTHYKLEVHIRRKHTHEKPYLCEMCGKNYSDSYSLNVHLKSKQHVQKAVDLGDVRPNKNTMGKSPEDKSKRKVTHKCKKCDYVTENYTDLRPHFLKEHIDSVLECKICGVHFVNEVAYSNHMSSNLHKKKEEEASKSTKTFTCIHCDKKFYCCKKFMLHKFVHQHVAEKNFKSNPSQVQLSPSGLDGKHQEFIDSIKTVPYGHKVNCPVCKRNISKQQIYTHLRIHEGSSPFGCIYCAKTFSCPKTLTRHLGVHLGLKCHVCSTCKKKFTRERALVLHQKMEHSNENKKFKCGLCGTSVHYKWRLRQHLLEHIKPIKCEHQGCTKSFSTRSKMEEHRRQHTGERPYLCHQCGYSASSQQLLTRHRRTHTGERKFQCEYCSYRALNSTNLKRHMRIHIGNKPYKCPYCNYTCNTHENIRKHVMKTKKHAGKLVYPCRICDDFATNSANEFKKHLALYHLIEDKDVDVLSVYAGLYNKVEDIRKLPEGARAIPSKERTSALPVRCN